MSTFPTNFVSLLHAPQEPLPGATLGGSAPYTQFYLVEDDRVLVCLNPCVFPAEMADAKREASVWPARLDSCMHFFDAKREAPLLEWAELLCKTTSPELLAKIQEAYGYDGLGILAVRGVPGYVEARADALPHAFNFGTLPEEVKARYVDEASTYSFGWSHGKEKLEGKPDTAKGSFYANPLHDRPFGHDPEAEKLHAPFARPNIWPCEEDAPGFTAAYKALASLMVGVGGELARHVDAFVRSVEPGYPPAPALALQRVVSDCRTHKARLLFYFPAPQGGAPGVDPGRTSSWCGWHNDHGSLTGLTSAMYFDANGTPIPCPDPSAGLFIRARSGALVQVSLPPDALAFQIGETAQVHSGGVLQATPHCVRAANAPGVSRCTMAVFMEPEWDHAMACPGLRDEQGVAAGASDTHSAGSGDETTTAGASHSGAVASADNAAVWERVLRGARGELLPPGVPTLTSRWTGPAQSFGEFTERTLGAYY